MAHVHFTLPQKWIDPKNPEHILFVANRIQAIRYGYTQRECPPQIQKDGSVHFPLTNDYWLLPCGSKHGEKECWHLVSRYSNEEELNLIVKALQLFIV